MNAKQKLIDKFETAFYKEFGKRATFDYHEDEDPNEERIEVGVPVEVMPWEGVKDAVGAILMDTGLSKYFEIGGAGLGMGFRDVSLYRKKE